MFQMCLYETNPQYLTNQQYLLGVWNSKIHKQHPNVVLGLFEESDSLGIKVVAKMMSSFGFEMLNSEPEIASYLPDLDVGNF